MISFNTLLRHLPSLNIRLGHATNSSSTHSVVFARSHEADFLLEEGFGWDNFVASSPESKVHYLAGQVWSHLGHRLSPQVRLALVDKFVYEGSGVPCPPQTDEYGEFPHTVDHQSVWALPQLQGSRSGYCAPAQDTTLNLEFVRDLRDYLISPEIVVFGGNDNDDAAPSLPNDAVRTLPFARDMGASGTPCNDWIARRATGKIWVLFDRTHGTRLTLDLTPGQAAVSRQEPHPAVPNLADIKITDKCSIGCSFCYQGSTISGRPASLYGLAQVAHALRSLGVFEVALGGGEPTEHPDFSQVLETFWSQGLSVNFTTRSTEWLSTPLLGIVLRYCSAWAYSVTTAQEVRDYWDKWLHARNAWWEGLRPEQQRTHQEKFHNPNLLYLHVVMGTVSREEFEGILVEAARHGAFTITLLGYKTDGRGHNHPKIEYSWLGEVLSRYTGEDAERHMRIGVDTPLAQEMAETLPALGVDRRLYRLAEGFDSVYIDAPAGKVCTASYGAGRSRCSRLWTPEARPAALKDPYAHVKELELSPVTIAGTILSHFTAQRDGAVLA